MIRVGSQAVIERTDELEVFVVIAEAGSLSAAAKRLRIPVSRVSRKLMKLEERLGVTLITRTTRRLRLTVEGERLLPRAERVLEQIDAAMHDLQAEEPTGRVRLGVPTMFAQLGMLAEVMRVRRQHVGVEVEILVQDDPAALMTYGCDALICAQRPRDSALKLTSLGRITPVLAASPDYLDRAGRPVDPKELAHHECLRFIGDAPQTHWVLVGPRGRKRKVRVGGGLSCNNSRFLHDAMMNGAGIGIAPWSRVNAPDSSLEMVLPRYRHVPFDLFLLSARGKNESPNAELALSMLTRGVRSAVGPEDVSP